MEKEFDVQVVSRDGEWHIKNFLVVKADIEKYIEPFFNVVVGLDNKKDVKKDLASLRKLSKALNDKRIAKEKAYLQPFNTYKSETENIIETLGKAITHLDSGVKVIEREADAINEEIAKGKEKAMIQLFTALGEDWLTWEDIKTEVGDCEMDFAKEKIEMIVGAKKTIMGTLDSDTQVAYLLSGTDLNKALVLGQQIKMAKKRLTNYVAF